ncbi:MAG TPA: RNA polymerase sigma factor [Rhodanobacteraceae bacterium]|nr:RNA polymerase sigma factor [Rhodanobacteraceae bacterium]
MLLTTPSDHQRLEQLLLEHAARVKKLLLRHGLARHGIDPDEIEQEVRIRLWHAIERDRSGVFGASYIQRIVASTVIDALRRAKVRPSEPGADEDQGLDTLHDSGPHPEHRASNDERVRILQRCLAEIPARRRLPITLHLEGFGFRDIGDKVGLSEEAARKLVSRGMADLRQRLRDAGVETSDD